MPRKHKRFRICMACSAGGHLAQAIAIAEGFQENYDIFFVTYQLPHLGQGVGNYRTHFVTNPHVHYPLFLVNLVQSFLLMIRERPDAVISTGSGVAIFPCLIAKLFGAKLVYVESGSRVVNPSRTGRLLYRYADLFLVQWPAMLKFYPKAVIGGPLL